MSLNWKNKVCCAVAAAGTAFYAYYGIYKILAESRGILGQDFLRGCIAAGNYFVGRSIYEMPPLVNPYSYFPPVTLIFMPFAHMRPETAALLWFALSQMLSLAVVLGLYRYGRPRGRCASAAAAALAVGFSTPLFQILLTGNINILIYAGLALIYALQLSGRTVLVPAMLAAFSIIKIFPAVLAGGLARRRQYAALAVFAVALAAAVAVSLIVFGTSDNLVYFRQLSAFTRFSGIFHTMSLTFFIKLFSPDAGMLLLFSANVLFFSLLFGAWWIISSGSGLKDERGVSAADIFALTVLMVLIAPASWPMYAALFAVPSYFIYLSLINGGSGLRYPWFFVAISMFLNLWEIIYYHSPLGPGGIPPSAVWLNREAYPVAYRTLFSLHFAAALLLFCWILANYKALAGIMGREAPKESGNSGKSAGVLI